MKRDGTLLDFVRGGLMGATTDVLGYPVDLAVMAMRPFGYNVPDNQVVGGSDWLASKLTSPNGSLAELAGRTASGMVTPGVNDLLRAAGLVKGAGPMRELTTYHGSPHRINNVDAENPLGKFDLSKIGTGEGAQAYGHGIYLAENPNVARQYKLAGSDGAFKIDGAPPRPKVDPLGPNRAAAVAYDDAVAKAKSLGLDGAITYYEDQVKFFPQYADEYAKPLEQLRKMKAQGAKTTPVGNFYTVDLPDEHIAKMLDWDAPLSEQPEAARELVMRYLGAEAGGLPADHRVIQRPQGGFAVVQEKLAADGKSPRLLLRTGSTRKYATEAEAIKGYWDGLTGAEFYKTLANDLGGKAEASDYMRQVGIPGIKYFDGGSRAAGEGTRNFVIFDPNIAKILKRE